MLSSELSWLFLWRLKVRDLGPFGPLVSLGSENKFIVNFFRNLFFRITHLLQLGVKLVFVVEGEAPELKWEAMQKRQQARFQQQPKNSYRGRGGRPQGRGGKQQGRRNFNSCLKEVSNPNTFSWSLLNIVMAIILEMKFVHKFVHKFHSWVP